MTDQPPLPAPVPTAEQRDAVVQQLSAAFADGRLELEDFEQRIEIAVRAQSVADLRLTLAGLQAPAPPAKAEDVEPAQVPAPPFRTDRPRASKRTVCVLSGQHRRGRWILSGLHQVVAVMGGAKLDLRDAELVEMITEIRITAFWGGVQVIVPPDMDVEVDGWAVMGGIDHRDVHPAPLESQVRRVRIYARAIMGGIEVKVRDRKVTAAPAEVDQLAEKRRRRLRDG